ncbi:hypothetical protein ES703_35937 [subsurface metagenome]
MTPKKEIYFHKINGKSKGKTLEILIDGEIVERILIQSSMGEKPTHFRIIGSNLFDENIAYRLNDPENYGDIIQKIKKIVKFEYNQKGIFGFFSRPKVEIKYHESHSTM